MGWWSRDNQWNLANRCQVSLVLSRLIARTLLLQQSVQLFDQFVKSRRVFLVLDTSAQSKHSFTLLGCHSVPFRERANANGTAKVKPIRDECRAAIG